MKVDKLGWYRLNEDKRLLLVHTFQPHCGRTIWYGIKMHCKNAVSNPMWDYPERDSEEVVEYLGPSIHDAFPEPAQPTPKLRPWTAEELWEHRDGWFRCIGAKIGGHRATWVGSTALQFNGSYESVETLLESWEYFEPASKAWRPCGVEVKS